MWKALVIFITILLLVPLEVEASGLPVGGIEVQGDDGISTLAFGYDGYRSYTLFPDDFVQKYIVQDEYWIMYLGDTDVSVYSVSGGTVTTGAKTVEGSYTFELKVPIIYTNEINPYGNGKGFFNGLFFLPNFSCTFQVLSGSSYIESNHFAVLGYEAEYHGVNGSGTVKFVNGGSNPRFHVPSDRAAVSIYVDVLCSFSFTGTTTGGTVDSHTVRFRPVVSFSGMDVYGYVNIPPGDYSNVVNLNTIAAKTTNIQTILDNFRNNTYTQMQTNNSYLESIRGYTNTAQLKLTDLVTISANFRDNTYTQLNTLYSTLSGFRSDQVAQFENLHIALSRNDQNNINVVNNVAKILHRFEVANHEDQIMVSTNITNQTTRLIDALLHETEYPDGDAGAGNLEDAFGKYDKAESDVTNTAFEWVGGFDPGTLFDFTGNLLVGMGQFNSFLTALLNAMGYYQYVIYIGLGLIFVGILVGVFRFR